MALLATASMMTWERGVGQAQFPFLRVVDACVIWQLFPEIRREAFSSTLKALS